MLSAGYFLHSCIRVCRKLCADFNHAIVRRICVEFNLKTRLKETPSTEQKKTPQHNSLDGEQIESPIIKFIIFFCECRTKRMVFLRADIASGGKCRQLQHDRVNEKQLHPVVVIMLNQNTI